MRTRRCSRRSCARSAPGQVRRAGALRRLALPDRGSTNAVPWRRDGPVGSGPWCGRGHAGHSGGAGRSGRKRCAARGDPARAGWPDAEYRRWCSARRPSYEEMAEVTGAGVSALKMRVKRAVSDCRASWRRHIMTDRPDPLSETPDERAFLERITPALRAPETLKSGFDDRAMEAVRAEAPIRYPGPRAPWWRRPRTVRLSPLAGLGLAAGFAGLVALGTPRHGRPVRRRGGTPGRDRCRYGALVRFAISAPEARRGAGGRLQRVGQRTSCPRRRSPESGPSRRRSRRDDTSTPSLSTACAGSSIPPQ